MSDEAVAGQVNKRITSHFPRKAVPSSKEKHLSQALHIVDGSALRINSRITDADPNCELPLDLHDD
eukprot:6758873-Pyramimonas_sp.AAC.1